MKKEEEEYLKNWSIGVGFVETFRKDKERVLKYLLESEYVSNHEIPSGLKIYQSMYEKPWGNIDAILSAFGI